MYLIPRLTDRNKYRFIVQLSRFRKGQAELWFVKYLIALFGLATQDLLSTLLLGFVFGVGCISVGWMWDKLELFVWEAEFGNRRNLFIAETLKFIHGKKT